MKTRSGGEMLENGLRVLLINSMAGDKIAYEEFLKITSDLVRKYLHYLSHGKSSAEGLEDLTQEILISIHTKKQTYQTHLPILPWIYAITKYSYIDYYRARKRAAPTIILDDQIGTSINENSWLELDGLLDSLSSEQIKMLQLVKVEGLSYAEAAHDLNISVSNLKVGIHRLVKSLKQRMKE